MRADVSNAAVFENFLALLNANVNVGKLILEWTSSLNQHIYSPFSNLDTSLR